MKIISSTDSFHNGFNSFPVTLNSCCLPPADHRAAEPNPTCSEIVSSYFYIKYKI